MTAQRSSRARLRDDVPTVAGLPLVGLGGSCGKPAFLLPYLVRWTDENTRALEGVAVEFDCFVEYGAYPHLKLNRPLAKVGCLTRT